MARPRSKQRIPKEQLAVAVRKHFNALPVNENEAIVNTLYKARTRGMYCFVFYALRERTRTS